MKDVWPDLLLDEAPTGADRRLVLRVPDQHPLFSGHFPGLPLLPGVAQIHWAARLGEARFTIEGPFTRLLNVKFQKPVLPGDEIGLNLAWDAGRRQLAFSYFSPAGSHASGKIEYGACGESA